MFRRQLSQRTCAQRFLLFCEPRALSQLHLFLRQITCSGRARLGGRTTFSTTSTQPVCNRSKPRSTDCCAPASPGQTCTRSASSVSAAFGGGDLIAGGARVGSMKTYHVQDVCLSWTSLHPTSGGPAQCSAFMFLHPVSTGHFTELWSTSQKYMITCHCREHSAGLPAGLGHV